jgi:hypothetical protein
LANEGGAVVTIEQTSGTRVTLTLIGILIGAMLFLFYGPADAPQISTLTALLAIPAALGGLVTQYVDPSGSRSPMGCFFWPTIFFLALTGIAVAAFDEGAVCLVLVIPIWIPAAIAGGLVQHLNARRRRHAAQQQHRFYASSWLFLPLLMMIWDQMWPVHWTNSSVERSIAIDASPEKIWPYLASIRDIRANEGKANFTHDVVGIPRPTEAVLSRESDRTVRKALWGKSARFEEVVQSVAPNREMTWAFSFPDNSIQEYTDRHISLAGPYLNIASGSYRLEPIAPNRTRLVLTTHYSMKVRLTGYFQWWGERFLGDVQNNVLAIVKDRVSADVGLNQ